MPNSLANHAHIDCMKINLYCQTGTGANHGQMDCMKTNFAMHGNRNIGESRKIDKLNGYFVTNYQQVALSNLLPQLSMPFLKCSGNDHNENLF